jgi:hypothetical protein
LEANSGAPAYVRVTEVAEDDTANRMTAFDCEIVRSAFRRSVVENRIAERDRRRYARLLAIEFTEMDEIDPEMIDWIVR